MQLPRNVRDGLVVFLIGIVPLLYTIYKLHAHKWDVLKTPLVISPGQFKSPTFSTDLDGTYIVSLAFDTMPDVNREDCLIGWDFPKGSCKDISPTLDFDWTAIGDVGSVENGGHFKIYGMTVLARMKSCLGRLRPSVEGTKRLF